MSSEFKAHLVDEGIKYQLSISGRPEQNGVAESMDRILTVHTCSMKLQADMSEEFWSEAMSHVCYLVNTPHLQSLIFKSQRRYCEESLWIIQLTNFWLLIVHVFTYVSLHSYIYLVINSANNCLNV